MREFNYYGNAVKSLGHTPIYKTHKYFARRPHNVFRELISHYTQKGDLVFDPFGGGGVTLVEALTEGRTVISSDINPVASFIQQNQVAEIDPIWFVEITEKMKRNVEQVFGDFFLTECQTCSSPGRIRWIEHAYIVNCPSCGEETDLRDSSKATNHSGKAKNGFYNCTSCTETFRSVEVVRKGSKILNIRYRCLSCDSQFTKEPDTSDIAKFCYFDENYKEIIESNHLIIPDDTIPEHWDRQQEDCLHRKGFYKFTDFFTRRNLIVSAFFFRTVEMQKDSLSETEYWFLNYLVSALLRYTNNMTFSTSSWMDGRPVAWAKHAYWTPNQFIEVNPIEYFENRVKAFNSAIKDRKTRFQGKCFSFDVQKVVRGEKDYAVVCGDSAQTELPDNSVDFILTDPPYGSNVQYGELCRFWEVWQKGRSPFMPTDTSLKYEAVVHRKTKDENYSKSFDDYHDLLHAVFSECFRVLKPEGVMAFTFNNKNFRAWYAVVMAAINAGFSIEAKGIFFQEGIHAYRDTAHMRFDGTPQGDFVYSFRKTVKEIDHANAPKSLEACVNNALANIESQTSFTETELFVNVFAEATLFLIEQMADGKSDTEINEMFSNLDLESYIESHSDAIRDGATWRRNDVKREAAQLQLDLPQ